MTADDVVILPAFGVTIEMLPRLSALGCTLVDTTCGSVLNVWKNVRRYTQDGFTSVIHGKHWHEETQATASQALQSARGRYLVVYDKAEAGIVCDYICGKGDRAAFLAQFQDATSPGFDPDVDLGRIGLANQTTMLMSESLEIGEMFRAAMLERYGEAEIARTVSRVRYDLQRDAGSAGRRHPAVAGRAPRSHDRDRRLQQQQHL